MESLLFNDQAKILKTHIEQIVAIKIKYLVL